MQKLIVNGRRRNVEVAGDTPLLWVLRDDLGLTATKYGCGAGVCGACTVLVDGVATRSCLTAVAEAADKRVTTLEGLAGSHRVQAAWIAADVPQCGYCQSGMIMAAVALLAAKPRPTDTDIDDAITNICRCGTYPRVRAAIHSTAAVLIQKEAKS